MIPLDVHSESLLSMPFLGCGDTLDGMGQEALRIDVGESCGQGPNTHLVMDADLWTSAASQSMVSFVPSVEIAIFGTPVPAGSKTTGARSDGSRFVRDSSGARGQEWRKSVSQVGGAVMSGRALLDGPLALFLTFFVARPKGHYGKRGVLPSALRVPTKKPDTTKLVRAVEDALTGIVWRDDAQVIYQCAAKSYTESQARCIVRVFEIRFSERG